MAHVLKIMLTGRVLIYFFPLFSAPPACYISSHLHNLSVSPPALFVPASPFFYPPMPLSLLLTCPLSYPPPHHAGLRKHDVCFLITVRPNLPYGTRFDRRQNFVEQTGLAYVRGCEVQGMLDDRGRVIEEGGHCM